MVLAYNNPQDLSEAFAEHGPQIAGVIVEPVVGNMGCVVPTAEFLAAIGPGRIIQMQPGTYDLSKVIQRNTKCLYRNCVKIFL